MYTENKKSVFESLKAVKQSNLSPPGPIYLYEQVEMHFKNNDIQCLS